MPPMRRLALPTGNPCPACNGARVMPATGQACRHCRGTGLSLQSTQFPAGGLGKGGRSSGPAASSPNRFPQSRSASMPIFPAGSGMIVVPQPMDMPPPMPRPAPAGPYEQDSSLGEEAMVETYNNAINVTNALSVQLLQKNTARKGMVISNPSTTLTLFLSFTSRAATTRSFPLFPTGSVQFFSGIKQYIPKDEVWALASAAGPILVNALEFS